MLDTIAISIPERCFSIKYQDRFTPNAITIMRPVYTASNFHKAIYNPSKAERQRGYHPRLTLINRAYGAAKGIWLKIEFSAPKLLFGNNFEEICNDEALSSVTHELLKRLKSMGIETTEIALLAAKVNAIHYSKNVLLERETPTYLIIQTLENLDLSRQLDLTQTDFRNSGQMVKYHSSSYEIALYDKVKDLEQVSKYGEKRGIENDYGDMPLLYQHIQKPEVLRFEVRLGSRKLTSLLKTLNITHDKTLSCLFGPDISRAVLLHYWGIITKNLYLMSIDTNDTERLIYAARKAFPRKQIGKIMELLHFVHCCQKMGARGARVVLGLKDHQWYRLRRDAKALGDYTICPRFSILSGIKNDLIDFIPLARADIVDEALLNKKM